MSAQHWTTNSTLFFRMSFENDSDTNTEVPDLGSAASYRLLA